jgi:hypothetical protein
MGEKTVVYATPAATGVPEASAISHEAVCRGRIVNRRPP